MVAQTRVYMKQGEYLVDGDGGDGAQQEGVRARQGDIKTW